MRYGIILTGIMLGAYLSLAQPNDSLTTADDSLALATQEAQVTRLMDSLKTVSRRDTVIVTAAWSATQHFLSLAQAQRDTAAWLRALEEARLLLRRQRRYAAVDSLTDLMRQLRLSQSYDVAFIYGDSTADAGWKRVYLVDHTRLWWDSSGRAMTDLLPQLDSLPFGYAERPDIDWSQFRGAYWLRLRLHNSSPTEGRHFFTIGRQLSAWDSVDFYLLAGGEVIAHAQTGNARPEALRDISTSAHTVQLLIPAQTPCQLLVRLAAPVTEDPPTRIRVAHVDYYFERADRANDRFVNGIFQGIVLIQLMYFLLFFLSTRDAIYGYYVLYILGLSIFIVTSNYYPEYLSPRYVNSGLLYALSIWLATVGLYTFSSAYLNFKQLLPSWYSVVRVLLGIFTVLWLGLTITLYVFDGESVGGIAALGTLSVVIALFLFISLIFMPIWGIQALRRGYIPARYYLLASVFLILGMAVPMVLFVAGAFLQEPERFMDQDTVSLFMQGGIALQLSLFALAVGHQRNQLEHDKRDALEQNLAMQQRINTATARFVPYEFLQSLGHNSILDVHLGDQVEKEVTVFFSDIRGYTTLSEQMTPSENFRFLNSYLGRVGPIIKANRGFVNQYFGDGIMALFMPPEPGVSSPRDAVEAAIQMQEALRAYNAERLAKGRQTIVTGIGLHSGPLMLGVIGDARRMDVGVVSDTVNTAARMEGLTKYYGAALLASEYTLKGIPNPQDFAHRYLGQVLVKGKVEPLGIYEFLAAETPEQAQLKADTAATFAQALADYFARDFEAAVTGWLHILQHNPGDRAAQLYYQRALAARDQGVTNDWTGVETMLSK